MKYMLFISLSLLLFIPFYSVHYHLFIVLNCIWPLCHINIFVPWNEMKHSVFLSSKQNWNLLKLDSDSFRCYHCIRWFVHLLHLLFVILFLFHAVFNNTANKVSILVALVSFSTQVKCHSVVRCLSVHNALFVQHLDWTHIGTIKTESQSDFQYRKAIID